MRELKKCDCTDQMREMMSLDLDGLLDEQRRQQVEAHLSTCFECRQDWAKMQRISTLLDGAPMKGPSLGFSTRVERRLADEARNRRRLFRGAAVLTGSLSLATITAALLVIIGLDATVWHVLSSQPAVQQEGNTISQVASGLGLLGKAASVFLVDLLARYGLPALLVFGIGLLLVAGVWAWLLSRRSRNSQRNKFA